MPEMIIILLLAIIAFSFQSISSSEILRYNRHNLFVFLRTFGQRQVWPSDSVPYSNLQVRADE